VIAGIELLDVLHIDDPVGASPVHLGAGLWGVLSVGLFATNDGITAAFTGPTEQYGLLVGGGAEQLGIQALAAAAIIGWTAATSAVLFLGLKFTIGLRVSEEEEMTGLDLGEHGMPAYSFGDVTGDGMRPSGAPGTVPTYATSSSPAAPAP
jgi:Amt family ammonium transporter